MKIFISSTYVDLIELRKIVIEYFNQFPIKVESMEIWASAPEEPISKCLEKVRESDIYVGIIGHRYGSIDEATGLSITELEYNEAKKNNLPILLFIMSEDFKVHPKYVDKGANFERLSRFKETLMNQHFVSFFNDEREFSDQLNTSFKKFLEDTDYDIQNLNLQTVKDKILDAFENVDFPEDFRINVSNIDITEDLLTELQDIIKGLEQFHDNISQSYQNQYSDLLLVLSEFNISEENLTEKFDYYSNPFNGRDWEMISFFPNSIMALKKVLYSMKIKHLIGKAYDEPWSLDLSSELDSTIKNFQTFIKTSHLLD